MTYDFKARKIVAVISDSLEPWQQMNVLGHMAIAIGANKDHELMGRDTLTDASDVTHSGIPRYGFVIKKGNQEAIANLARSARETEGVLLIDFPRDMLDTRHDDELSESMSKKTEGEFEYLGVTLYGDTESVGELTKEFELFS